MFVSACMRLALHVEFIIMSLLVRPPALFAYLSPVQLLCFLTVQKIRLSRMFIAVCTRGAAQMSIRVHLNVLHCCTVRVSLAVYMGRPPSALS